MKFDLRAEPIYQRVLPFEGVEVKGNGQYQLRPPAFQHLEIEKQDVTDFLVLKEPPRDYVSKGPGVVPITGSAAPALFLHFAFARNTDDLRQLSERLGEMGAGLYEIWPQESTSSGRNPRGEPLALIESEAAAMRSAVHLWAEVEPGSVRPKSGLAPSETSAVVTAINKRLPGSYRVTMSEDLSLSATPDSILAKLWVQFAIAVQRGRRFGVCDECGSWFRDTTQGRFKKRFCSQACKQREFRSRESRKAARELVAKFRKKHDATRMGR